MTELGEQNNVAGMYIYNCKTTAQNALQEEHARQLAKLEEAKREAEQWAERLEQEAGQRAEREAAQQWQRFRDEAIRGYWSAVQSLLNESDRRRQALTQEGEGRMREALEAAQTPLMIVPAILALRHGLNVQHLDSHVQQLMHEPRGYGQAMLDA
ncbi:MAG: hypothetical protein LQ342_004149 [Letrouitia transgressa]|nr:MAG: hypothetical protein LQ342_004149 [Letrouitia transgressa]